MSKQLAKSDFSIPRLKSALVSARKEAHQARLDMRLANRAVLRGLLARDDAAALEGREREQIARVNLRRANEIIIAALAELAELNAAPPALDPNHMARNSDALRSVIRTAIAREIA